MASHGVLGGQQEFVVTLFRDGECLPRFGGERFCGLELALGWFPVGSARLGRVERGTKVLETKAFTGFDSKWTLGHAVGWIREDVHVGCLGFVKEAIHGRSAAGVTLHALSVLRIGAALLWCIEIQGCCHTGPNKSGAKRPELDKESRPGTLHSFNIGHFDGRSFSGVGCADAIGRG